jgi:hypothetical protein
MRGCLQRIVWLTVLAAFGMATGMDHAGGLDAHAIAEAASDARAADAGAVPADAALAGALAALHAAVGGFVDVEAARAAGYERASECMAGERGAQGVHYANGALSEPSLAIDTPQLLMYEPLSDGSLRFVGVEYSVARAAWHDAGHAERPTLFDTTFGLDSTRLDEPRYRLHVWIAQFNPSGLFADWNPLVRCDHAPRARNIVIDLDMP